MWTQWDLATVGCGHGGMWTQWDLDTVGSGHGEIWTQWDVDTVGSGHRGIWTRWDVDTVGSGHGGMWTQWDLDTVGCGHSGMWTQWDLCARRSHPMLPSASRSEDEWIPCYVTAAGRPEVNRQAFHPGDAIPLRIPQGRAGIRDAAADGRPAAGHHLQPEALPGSTHDWRLP
jgi:hypothetical protein